MQRIFEQFQEHPNVRLVSVIPIAAIAESEHETLFITSVERYEDESMIRGVMILGADHPEHEWRNRGRPGHPFFMVSMDDDLGTEYVSMPDSGGGGGHRYNFTLRLKPAIPDDARAVTLSISAPQWDTEATRRFYTEGTRPPALWTVSIDPSTGTHTIHASDAT